MKKILLIAGYILFILVFAVIFSFLWGFTFFSALNEFKVISDKDNWLFAILFTVVCTIAIMIYAITDLVSKKKIKFTNWLAMNFPNLILYYLITQICFISLKSKIIFTYEQLMQLVSIEWTILGLSITIFLVWYVIVTEFLKKRKPQIKSNVSILEESRQIEKRSEFYQTASNLFKAITLLTINLFVVIGATSSVYLIDKGANLFNQSLIIIGFYFCTNTIIELFLGILLPLRKEKKELLKGVKVSSKEITIQNETNEKIEKIVIAIQQIDKLENFDDEKKEKIKAELLKEITSSNENVNEV